MKGSPAFLRDIFENPGSRSFALTNDVLALATLVSVAALVLETAASLSPYHSLFKAVEYGTVALFTLEFLGRWWTAKSGWRYVFSFFGMIDLLAIIPTYLGLTNLTFLKTSRALRILRFLRILRLAKLARKNKHFSTNSIYVLNIQIYLVSLLTALLVMGTLLYIVEGDRSYAKDIPNAMYWVFSVIIGGLPFEKPITSLGTFILIATRFISLILLGLLISLTATITRKLLIGSEKDSE